MKQLILFLIIILSNLTSNSQELKPGFDPDEYMNLLCISARQSDTPWIDVKLPYPDGFNLVYRSPESGLFNLWDLWINLKGVAVISIRGTINETGSWLENFHTGMIPAIGSIKIAKDEVFNYKLANNPDAYIHAGWTIGLASFADDIKSKIDSVYNSGIKNILIIGHSQGGAIAYLLSSYLYYKKEDGSLPKDMKIKTYCSAAPKPGNIFYAFDFEQITYGGWAFNVVNPLDWVPQSPFSIQKIDDYSDVNPYQNADKVIKSQKWPSRIFIKRFFNKLRRPLNKSAERFDKYLGKKAGTYVQSYLPYYEIPEFTGSQYYTRAGHQIVLEPDSVYFNEYAKRQHTFQHHSLRGYYYLAGKLKDK
jgi:pimeloyl-ACP methyl ester carboxylesterase